MIAAPENLQTAAAAAAATRGAVMPGFVYSGQLTTGQHWNKKPAMSKAPNTTSNAGDAEGQAGLPLGSSPSMPPQPLASPANQLCPSATAHLFHTTTLPRELLERALAIDECEYETEHREAAITLTIHRKE